ncbi:HyaD/HybD family hydrogenase maturation endopeptidase [Beggiatoa leptomitoformis]|uniref:HyaD/HybD family hydrogenase maturation endopeptidase n=1 Tax=Beggiatoa leptomitoformis TaxID=288004 RepID=A0A2N9YIN8_9GAMM|nr:HyaD/HybD family hydrogenase maturation endopeptidase [Beggiatoa leptomitoformis]ALG67440.1 HyaD/HybD family hydrogenase maturation endopeptidase [Beggiatoa leptomitoformis]AUI70343.1 HyaD/HybD family hydrogenase maturation endopeptidase [Beggiatoa leptomitoformis]
MTTPTILILGIGNLLWADEGFGVRTVDFLYRHYQFPPHVQLMDGGTQGLYLLSYIQAVEKLLIFDAIDYGLPAGTIKEVLNDDVPRFMGAKKMSLHQTGFQEVLAAAQFTNQYPKEVVLLGVQPLQLDDYGGSLTPLIKAQMPTIIDLALHHLNRWGIATAPRIPPLTAQAGLSEGALAIERYEAERPAAHFACRIGDARILNQHLPDSND